jgi:hypothetical protein
MESKAPTVQLQLEMKQNLERMNDIRGKLMELDVQRAITRHVAAVAERTIAEQNASSGADASVVNNQRLIIAQCGEKLAAFDIDAAKLMQEHDKIRVAVGG